MFFLKVLIAMIYKNMKVSILQEHIFNADTYVN